METSLACPGCGTRLDWTALTKLFRVGLAFGTIASLLFGMSYASIFVAPVAGLLLGFLGACGVAVGGVAAGPWYFRHVVRKGFEPPTLPPRQQCPECGEEFTEPVSGPCPVCGTELRPPLDPIRAMCSDSNDVWS